MKCVSYDSDVENNVVKQNEKNESLIFHRGLQHVVRCEEEMKFDVILKKYHDTNCLYCFRSKHHSFDLLFIPPNNFIIQIANTLSDKGQHTISLQSMLILCEQLKKVNYITAVNECDKSQWISFSNSFKINDKDSLIAVKKYEKVEKLAATITRTYDRLPLEFKEKLSKFRQFVGLVPIRRTFSTFSKNVFFLHRPFLTVKRHEIFFKKFGLNSRNLE